MAVAFFSIDIATIGVDEVVENLSSRVFMVISVRIRGDFHLVTVESKTSD